MNTKTKQEIRNYLLENSSKRLELCKQINCFNNSMDFADTTTIQELAETMDTYELARAIIYGEVNSIEDDVRFNAYMNLESVTTYDLEGESEDYIDEIIEHIDDYGFQHLNNIDLEILYDDYESEV